MPHSREIVVSSRAADRIAAARAWLEALPNACEVLVIASVKEAADDLVRGFAVTRGAMLGVHRMTMNRLVRGLLPLTVLRPRRSRRARFSAWLRPMRWLISDRCSIVPVFRARSRRRLPN